MSPVAASGCSSFTSLQGAPSAFDAGCAAKLPWAAEHLSPLEASDTELQNEELNVGWPDGSFWVRYMSAAGPMQSSRQAESSRSTQFQWTLFICARSLSKRVPIRRKVLTF